MLPDVLAEPPELPVAAGEQFASSSPSHNQGLR